MRVFHTFLTVLSSEISLCYVTYGQDPKSPLPNDAFVNCVKENSVCVWDRQVHKWVLRKERDIDVYVYKTKEGEWLKEYDMDKPLSSRKEDDLRKERGIDAYVYQLREGDACGRVTFKMV